ncbi:hypothetical protein [Pseudomonas sp. TMW22091]|uniref:hypothetical protein n=1 Tax=Pseudomonas sp. TMW22091 TaxID=2506435 RepID=UPI001F10BEDB|nr:hypothetical protein [Pseudomonas sp. TMW22091]MCH4875224.1 hypothetical protein [Pseudomonas sp. TMW22091]
MSYPYSPESFKFDPNQPINLTMDWFANTSYYPPRAGVLTEPLVNGQAAFGAVHDAIENARHSVDIITWGFDPAMRLKRPVGLRVGDLLAAKGKQGLTVRVLVWRNVLADFVEKTLPGIGLGGSGGTALGSGIMNGTAADNEVFRLDKRRTQNLQKIGLLGQDLLLAEYLRQNKSPSYDPVFVAKAALRLKEWQDENAEINRLAEEQESAQGYNKISGSGGTQHDPWGQIYTRDWFKNVNSSRMNNVEFRTRDFDSTTETVMNEEQSSIVRGRFAILRDLLNAEGISDLSIGQMVLLTQFASHHQKMVLVDYGTPQAIGFVMGHNLHRNYWDTDAHLFDDLKARRNKGFGPWQDISMKVTGPVLVDLSHNFAQAWDLENPWYTRWFADTSLRKERDALPIPDVVTTTAHSVAQVCRTQPQYGEKSILEHYIKAIGNARDYVYMENQYFRYSDFAKRLSTIAKTRKNRGAKGDVYLFVVTNTPDSKTASGTTYEMLQALGQEQLMPQVQRDLAQGLTEHLEDLEHLKNTPPFQPYQLPAHQEKIQKLQAKVDALLEQGITPEVGERLDGLTPEQIAELAAKTDADKKPYELREIPGLKIIIATLATSDPAPGSAPPLPMSAETEAQLNAPVTKARYKNIYVHSKLLLVDDVYTLLSSANINIRSMHSDSELGIAHPHPVLAKSLREKLWGMHSGEVKSTSELNFSLWNKQMDKNWKARIKGIPLESHLQRFWDITTPYSPAFTVD